ncbi:type I-E CRISPR-associated protein Cse1/CasA [Photorhabdus laumondii subsp. laumondii]|uniref:Photorhabdus luminescens subsp. laumondii TTO1 complete genome segment 3/17 n=2 Tax=Photorhabdus laumondii subsp. laumondii TaxID=141679 RepID=Q7N8H8_PHOLL|nr:MULTISPECIES: type I-E CRISPR-associated protein Cse1/CasA [Photorhabdus]AWK40689.1 type I-E CRISPR-associated protein Cse1/CasA [Photorhabdus laumondii subsp. laumondii]AXG41504.1 type I-E CRISPR-associated protein Cse1/CasA [Photorhabdus laumondii subsp. laumondii]AXG46026.1 type I-E CRISPR-associated protein Cse1/CasA [Photorhabdus laumondii subsp. laumondii]KTL61064.1 type I-E CRISPR-associated protein Cse1/CasA [Photorhabdus laumondii subsp. laumondii]MCC8384183.1 type I-E CRISPR-assoc
MNLVQDPWLPFRLRDGSEKVLPINAICDHDVMDFALPRADFQGAACQFAIGLLQTVFAPEDKYQWHALYETSPDKKVLQQNFNKVIHAFNVTGIGPLFMQDFDPLQTVKSTTVAGLLIEAPGANGLRLNTDHFIKRGIGDVMSLEMATLALFTLQINAPSGGVGHRVGLRGGGPLTTLVVPQQTDATLWQKLWLNVISRSEWHYSEPDLTSAQVFPWLAPTKVSVNEGTEIHATDVHPLHMYWAMPRRIRLIVEKGENICKISGKYSEFTVSEYRAQNYGGNYTGNWSHPLTPYKWDPKKLTPPLSIKGQPGGVTYKIWDALVFTSHESGQRCAPVVSHFYSLCCHFAELRRVMPRLWVFGYDMDNMKARCWYSVTVPLFFVLFEQQEKILYQVKELQKLAINMIWLCRNQIKAAWFEKPVDVKGDTSFIDLTFWQQSESLFFSVVHQLIDNANSDAPFLTPEQAKHWLNTLRYLCRDLFDEYVALSELGNERSIAKRMKARQQLIIGLYGQKALKEIKTFITNHHIHSGKEEV